MSRYQLAYLFMFEMASKYVKRLPGLFFGKWGGHYIAALASRGINIHIVVIFAIANTD
jgi:hypothetical protein